METEVINTGNEFWAWFSPIFKSPMGYLTIGISIALAWALRLWEEFPNKIILPITCLSAGFLFTVVGDRALVPDTVPLGYGRSIALACYGILIGFGAFIAEKAFVGKQLSNLTGIGKSASLLMLCLVLATGCSQRQLDKTGVYGSGRAVIGLTHDASEEARLAAGRILYEADSVIVRADRLLNAFVDWERANRQVINSPGVQRAAENIAANKDIWLTEAIRLRDEFSLRPIAEKATALENTLSLIRTALTTALGHMAEHTTDK
jgi:hypothetical protein